MLLSVVVTYKVLVPVGCKGGWRDFFDKNKDNIGIIELFKKIKDNTCYCDELGSPDGEC